MFEDEDGLKRENERMALSLKAFGGGVWDYDIDADVLVCDDRWHAILGLDPAVGAVGSIDGFKRYIHPDDIGQATRIDWQEINLLVDRDERYHREFRIVRTDGSIRTINSVACLVRDPASGHCRAVGCMTDVTVTEGSLPATDRDIVPSATASVLSGRERECLLWVSIGKTAWETSIILDLSSRTVEFHLANAVRKLSAANKVHAAAIAIRSGIL